jgi:hypothetical protein
VKAVLFYESADDVGSKAPAHFAAHLARIHEFQARGEIRDWNEILGPE